MGDVSGTAESNLKGGGSTAESASYLGKHTPPPHREMFEI